MSWVTIIWSMTAAACLTLGLIHLIIWSRQRDAWANLLFALVAFGTAAFTGFEIAMMRLFDVALLFRAAKIRHDLVNNSVADGDWCLRHDGVDPIAGGASPHARRN